MRILKQLIYGAFYFLILAGVVGGTYFYFFRPAPSCVDGIQNQEEEDVDCGGPCIACEIKDAQPIVESPAALYGVDRDFSAAVTVRNPAGSYGASMFDYEVNFYDSQGTALVRPIRNRSFIYAGETKRLVESGVRITTGIPASAEFTLLPGTVVWEHSNDFFEPNFELRDISAAIEGGVVSITGNFANVNNFTITRAIISAFVIDDSGRRIGASKTELSNIGAFRVEGFRIAIPVRSADRETVDMEATAGSVRAEVLK